MEKYDILNKARKMTDPSAKKVSMTITIKQNSLYKGCVLYLVIPILFFFMGWLKFGVGLFLSALLLSASILFLYKVNDIIKNDNYIIVSKEYYITFIIL